MTPGEPPGHGTGWPGYGTGWPGYGTGWPGYGTEWTSSDPNLAGVAAAGLDPAHAQWLAAVAQSVPARLDAVVPDWRGVADPLVTLAATFGLALGVLARRYPQVREALSAVAEAHPSFGTLPAGQRLSVLETLAGDPLLVVDWLEEAVPGLDRERAVQLVA